MRLSCAGTETGTELLGPLDSAPCCCSMRSYSGLQNFYLHCCSKKGHPGVTEDGGESFLWAAILRDCRDFQVITKYPSTLHLPWTLQTCVSPDSKISWLYNSRELPLSSWKTHRQKNKLPSQWLNQKPSPRSHSFVTLTITYIFLFCFTSCNSQVREHLGLDFT